MRILLAIVHHWNPQGSGLHASLRKDPEPRRRALQDQLLSLARLNNHQGQLHIAGRRVEDANEALRHQITIKVVTDGQHHVLDRLDPPFRALAKEVATTPASPMHLGFEAQRVLAEHLDDGYDLYGYLEDDLLISDPLFFHKIFWFQLSVGSERLLLPHRVELFWEPDRVNKLYIDGPMVEEELRQLIPKPAEAISANLPGGPIEFCSPSNPHAGCFILSHQQLKHWSQQPWFLDGDVRFISPLESAATLGISRTFQLYKPAMRQAAFLELQHWGTSFRSLIGKSVAPPAPCDTSG